MRATGIVRRIDDLGRIMVPKEIRRTMRIKDGDPLEIFVENGAIIYKKYSPVAELKDFAQKYAEALQKTTGHMCFITDRDNTVAVNGVQRSSYLAKSLTPQLEKIIENRELFQSNSAAGIKIINDQTITLRSIVLYPIISNGDVMGSVILASVADDMGETDSALVKSAAFFLGKQFED